MTAAGNKNAYCTDQSLNRKLTSQPATVSWRRAPGGRASPRCGRGRANLPLAPEECGYSRAPRLGTGKVRPRNYDALSVAYPRSVDFQLVAVRWFHSANVALLPRLLARRGRGGHRPAGALGASEPDIEQRAVCPSTRSR